jgi:DNA polymerase-3 subunit gamma/tau
MAYTVLARKYRSQTFDDVVGQDPIAQTLKNAIKTGRVAHAYLFTGTRGVGKTTMARILAKSLNCLAADAPTIQPCCKCESCVAINAGDDIDVIEIDGASNRGIDNIRELRQNVIYRPARCRFKIYIIDEVHMLTTESFNALLKTLEEPPSHVKFIFATTEPNKVILTIQSRCQRFDFNNITAPKIAGQLKSILKQEKIKYEEDLVLPLAKMANGSMRDALSLLDRLISTGTEPLSASLLEEFLGCPNSEKIWNLIAEIGSSNAAGTLAAVEDLISGGVSEVQIVDSLIEYMRDLMVAKSAGAETELLVLTAQQRKRAGELAEKFDVAALIYNITALEKLRWTIKNSDTARALLEASLLRFALSEHFLNVDQLLSQLQASPAGTIKKKEPMDERFILRSSPPQVRAATENGRGTMDDRRVTKGEHQASPVRRSFSEDGSIENQEKPQTTNSEHRESSIENLVSAEQAGAGQEKAEPVASEQKQAQPAPNRLKTSSQRKNELINHPAVKTVLMGLDATICGVEEDK